MRPIDADELKKAILEERDKIPLEIVERYSFGVATPNKHGESMRGGIRKALRCLEETPTLEVMPVIRCNGCKHYECGKCGIIVYIMDGYYTDTFEVRKPNDFCSLAERKDNATD